MAKYFWIRPLTSTRYIWVPLALLIKENLRIEPLFIVISEADKDFYLKISQGALNGENFLIEPNFYLECERNHPESTDIFNALNAYEEKYNFTVYRDIIQADRHIGQKWAWAWDGSPQSRCMSNTRRFGALRACLEALKYFEHLNLKWPPKFVIGSGIGTGLSGKPMALICKKNKIPLRSAVGARFNRYAYWATDEFCNNFEIRQKIKSLEYEKIPPSQNETHALQESENFKDFHKSHSKKSKSIINAIGTSSITFLKNYYSVLRRRRATKTGYYPSSLASLPLKNWYAQRQFKNKGFKNISELPKATKYFLFPLQMEFEASLQGEAPNLPPSFTLIHQISLSLPAGAILLVKEHPLQGGRRPKFFYGLIENLHNVVLIKPTIKAQMIFDKIDAVIQVNSSLGYEALAQGIPVFSLSPHGIIHGSSLNEAILSPNDYQKLKKFCLNDMSHSRAARRHLALSFQKAIRTSCFELPSPEKSFNTLLSKKDVEGIYLHLVKSL